MAAVIVTREATAELMFAPPPIFSAKFDLLDGASVTADDENNAARWKYCSAV